MPSTPDLPRRALCAATLLLPYVARAQTADTQPRLDVPYVPTPMPVVQKMLDLAGVKQGETLFDLGCGDGRIVVTAAKERGASGVGIDLNPERISEARANAEKAGVAARARFVVGDLFQADVSKANVVTLYLLPAINRRLRPQLWRQLEVGSRVVSHSFDMGEEWPPERSEMVMGAMIYRWTITARNKSALLRSAPRLT